MDSLESLSLEDIPLPVLALQQRSKSQAVASTRYKPMAHAIRSQAKPPSSKKTLDQSTLFTLNKKRTSVITKGVRAGKAPAPTKLCTDGKKDTLKMRAPTAMSSSTSYIEITSDDESEERSGWPENLFDAKLSSIMMKTDLQLEEEFAPVESGALPASLDELFSSQRNPTCAAPKAGEALASLDKPPSSQQDPSRAAPNVGAFPSLDELLSSEQNPSCAAARAEGALASLDKPPLSQQNPSRAAPDVGAFPALDELLSSEQNPSCAAPRAEEPLQNCSCSQQQLKMLLDLKKDFTSLARQQTTCIELLSRLLQRMDKNERRNDNPGPYTQK